MGIVIIVLIIFILLIYFLNNKPKFMNQNTIKNYHFSVDWGGSRVGFMEVSGLNIEVEAITFREGSSRVDSFKQLPGLTKYANISLKREIIQGDNEFFNWINSIQSGETERRDISISLLDAVHNPVVVWRVRDAFPIQYYGPVLNAQDSGLAVETLVLTHEGLLVTT